MTEYQLNKLSREITWEEIELLLDKAMEYERKWRSLTPGLFYVVEGGWGDLYKHEILDVDAENRTILVKDYSTNQISTYHFIPTELFTKEEFDEKFT